MELGPRIKSLRESAGLTQVEFAKILKISNTTLSQYESGTRVPGDEIKEAIADHFGVSLDYLFGRTDKKPSTPGGEHKIEKQDLMAAFWGGDKDLSPEDMNAMWNDVENFAAFVAEKKKREKQG